MLVDVKTLAVNANVVIAVAVHAFLYQHHDAISCLTSARCSWPSAHEHATEL